jgi:hypothetical protein
MNCRLPRETLCTEDFSNYWVTPPRLCQVILNLHSVSYRKICSVMRQLHNRKVSEKHLLIMVNYFTSKRSIFNKRINYTFFMFDVINIFYISLPCWSNIKLCTVVDRERVSVLRLDHWVQTSGHPCSRTKGNVLAHWRKISDPAQTSLIREDKVILWLALITPALFKLWHSQSDNSFLQQPCSCS